MHKGIFVDVSTVAKLGLTSLQPNRYPARVFAAKLPLDVREHPPQRDPSLEHRGVAVLMWLFVHQLWMELYSPFLSFSASFSKRNSLARSSCSSDKLLLHRFRAVRANAAFDLTSAVGN